MDINIPGHISGAVNYDFCLNMVKELHMIFGISLETFSGNVLPYIEGTNGWETALVNTCRKTSKGMVYQYYASLGWQDGDSFDSWLSGKIVGMKLMLPGEEKGYIAESSGCREEDLRLCAKAGRYCMSEVLERAGCKDKCSGLDGFPCTGHEGMPKTLSYDIGNAIKAKLGLDPGKDYFICSQCGKRFWNIVKNNGDICSQCQEINAFGDEKTYYKNSCEENKKFKEYLRI